jgi:hypothetical protein
VFYDDDHSPITVYRSATIDQPYLGRGTFWTPRRDQAEAFLEHSNHEASRVLAFMVSRGEALRETAQPQLAIYEATVDPATVLDLRAEPWDQPWLHTLRSMADGNTAEYRAAVEQMAAMLADRPDTIEWLLIVNHEAWLAAAGFTDDVWWDEFIRLGDPPPVDPEFLRWLADHNIEVIDDSPAMEDVCITPELAAQWLRCAHSLHGPNDPAVVAHYTELMRTGRWQEQTLANGKGAEHPIYFDGAGRVRYGLQRLQACVQAGVSFMATVAYGAPKSGAEYETEVNQYRAVVDALEGEQAALKRLLRS